MNEPDVMVYLMTGFLDSGKTDFLKFTMEQEYFADGERTLLILCHKYNSPMRPEKAAAGHRARHPIFVEKA